MLEVGKFASAGYTYRFPVYDSGGTKIAVVDGARIHLTGDGEKAKITPRHEQNLTAYELEGKTILELRRMNAAALRGWAELYTPEGILVIARDAQTAAIARDGRPFGVAGITISGQTVNGAPIGILVRRQGESISVGVGVSGSFSLPTMPPFRRPGPGIP